MKEGDVAGDALLSVITDHVHNGRLQSKYIFIMFMYSFCMALEGERLVCVCGRGGEGGGERRFITV